MSRRVLVGWAIVPWAMTLASPAAAQDGAKGAPPERIDLTITQPPAPADEEECRRRREVGVVAGEIVVCGNRDREGPQPFSSREDARNRYAERTRNAGTLPTPDVAGPGIFRGPATVGGVCVPGVFNCPKPPALIVDVASLPPAPPGSDADRMARGLEPLGEDNRAITDRQMAARQRTELGLPEAAPADPDAAVSSEGSGAPAAPQ